MVQIRYIKLVSYFNVRHRHYLEMCFLEGKNIFFSLPAYCPSSRFPCILNLVECGRQKGPSATTSEDHC